MDRGAWWATVHRGHKELDTTERLTLHIYLYILDKCVIIGHETIHIHCLKMEK